MGLGTNQQTITTGDIFIPEIWSKVAQRAREAALHLASFVYRRDNEVVAMGDTLHTPTISNLSASNKSANTQVTLQAPSESNVDLSINKHKESSFLIEDVLSVKTQINLLKEYLRKASYSVGKQIDTDLFALYSGFSQSALGTAGSAVTLAVVAAAWSALSASDVPEEDRAWFFFPNAYSDLLQITAFTSVDFSKAIGSVSGGGMNGLTVGYMFGSPVKITTNVPSYSTGSPAVTAHRNLYLHKEALQLGMQKNIRTQMQYKQEYLGNLVTVDAIYGVGGYRADHGVEIDR